MTEVPHLIVRAELTVDGERSIGIAAESLVPKWFTKNPATSIEADNDAAREAVTLACEAGETALEAPSVFDLWLEIYREQGKEAESRGHPPLLAGLGASLVERAIIDGFCRAKGVTFASALRSGALGLQLAAIHPELDGLELRELIPTSPSRSLTIRHTVGLSDPLTEAEIAADERVSDGLPQSLETCVKEYGLTHFKLKLSGDIAHDLERLRSIHAILHARVGPRWAYTLDGNEQFESLGAFAEFWNAYSNDPDLNSGSGQLLFIEQPLRRDLVFEAQNAPDRIPDALVTMSPCVIDESDAELTSLPHALAVGYSGTSYKGCKGVFRGVANACLLEQRARLHPGREYILSAEDLTTVGPIGLLQDLAVIATLGIRHAERNGHHYFRGLATSDPCVRDVMLSHHGDLYRHHDRGFATPRISGGRVLLGSVVDAPFGHASAIDSRLLSIESP